jgi:TetR/AcrR family transcriptional regulator
MERAGNTSAEGREDSRERILKAATELMAARGYEGTSVQAIADAVGIRKQSVLYHFNSKEAIRNGVLEQLLLRWNDILPRLLMATAKSGLAKFDSVMDELIDFFTADPDRARLLVRELLDRPQELQDVLRNQARAWVDVVAGYVRKGQENGQIRSEIDPEAYVLQVACMALACLGTVECTLAMLPDSTRTEALSRSVEEVKRAARNSLFVDSYLEHQRSSVSRR